MIKAMIESVPDKATQNIFARRIPFKILFTFIPRNANSRRAPATNNNTKYFTMLIIFVFIFSGRSLQVWFIWYYLLLIIANKIKVGILLLQENVPGFEGKLFLLVFHKIPRQYKFLLSIRSVKRFVNNRHSFIKKKN